MAIPTNIKTLLTGEVVEWARIEFKETWDAEASLKTICAFANDIDNWGGGYIVIGVKDKPTGNPSDIVGVPVGKIDAYQKDLFNKCKLIRPEYTPIVEVAEYGGKKFIVIWAPGGSLRPYSSPKTMAKDNKERICYIRKMASTVTPTEEELRDLYSLADNVPFDDRVNHNADITDLNITLIQSYLKEIGSSLYESSFKMDFVDLCKSMNIISALPEYVKPKNVGLMFFSLTPEKFFPYAQIDVVQFPEDLGGDRIIEKTFRGPLHQQLREALQYIQNSIIQEQIIKKDNVAEAERFYNYPYAAIEEALSNAVYHKGYDVREPIEVRVLPDRIEILSHPGADRSITLEGLKTYRVFNRRYRNRRIGEFLKEMHLTEGRNTGFSKILNALKKNGSPAPLFETDENRTFFATTIYIKPSFMATDKNVGVNDTANGQDVGLNVDGNDTINDTISDTINDTINDTAKLVYDIVKANEKTTIVELMKKMRKSRPTITRAIADLKEKGYIKRGGSRKSGYWKILK